MQAHSSARLRAALHDELNGTSGGAERNDRRHHFCRQPLSSPKMHLFEASFQFKEELEEVIYIGGQRECAGADQIEFCLRERAYIRASSRLRKRELRLQLTKPSNGNLRVPHSLLANNFVAAATKS